MSFHFLLNLFICKYRLDIFKPIKKGWMNEKRNTRDYREGGYKKKSSHEKSQNG